MLHNRRSHSNEKPKHLLTSTRESLCVATETQHKIIKKKKTSPTSKYEEASIFKPQLMKEVFGTRNAKKSTYRITDSDLDITVTVPEGKLVIKGRWPRKLGTGPELGAQRLMGTGSVCTRSPQASGAAGPRAASNGWTGVTAEQAQHRQRRPELMTGGETGSANRLNKGSWPVSVPATHAGAISAVGTPPLHFVGLASTEGADIRFALI